VRAEKALISAFAQNRKCQCAVAERRFVPLAEIRTATSDGYGSLLDHLVSSREKRWRDFQAERSGSHKIDDELELC
jgi:hypothetical protein